MTASVDREGRAAAAALLEAFLACKLTGRQLEDAWPRSDDDAVEAIRGRVWHLYDDLTDGPFIPTPETSALLGRCIGFLKTDLPYTWPVPNRWHVLLSIPVALMTFGLSNRLLWRRYDFPDHWPFEDGDDHQAADEDGGVLRTRDGGVGDRADS